MMRYLALISFLLLACNASQNTNFFKSKKARKVAEKNLVYIYQNRGCPDFSKTYKNYGFKIECGTDVYDSLVQQKNNKVIEKIETHYGKGWFEKNFQLFMEID